MGYIWSSRSTIAWIIVLMATYYIVNWQVALALFASVVLVISVVYYTTGYAGKYLPFFGDWLRAHEQQEGYRLIRESRLCTQQELEQFNPKYKRTKSTEYVIRVPRKRTPFENKEVAKRIDAIRTLADATDTRVITRGKYHYCYFSRNKYPDPLASPVPWPGPSDNLRAVFIGENSDGKAVTISVEGTHTLILGMTGSGKSGLLRGVIESSVHAGADVRVIDLKGGVEFGGMGDHVATTPEQAHQVLAEVHRLICERQGIMTVNNQRLWDGPITVLAIDELALLSAKGYAALGDILRVGRAVGVSVIGAAQDALKESVPVRDLFTQQVVFRMPTATQTRLALPAWHEETPAHQIPPNLPGVGYLICDGIPQKFRAYEYVEETI